MKKWKREISALLAGVLMLTGCQGKPDKKLSEDVTSLVQKVRAEQKTELDQTLAAGINPFAYKMLTELEDGKNIFFSPYSIVLALAMLDNGAGTETKEELEKALGIRDLAGFNQQVAAYLAKEQEKEALLSTANSIWISNDMELADTADERLLKPIGKYYDAEAFQTDLSGKKALEEINQWVSGKTEGMIDPFLDEIPSGTEMMLLNAVYFNGEWKHKFLGNMTYEKEFHGMEETVTVEMMHQGEESFKYLEKGEIRGIELPYGESGYVMDILLPKSDSDKKITELFGKLTIEEKEQFLKELSEIGEKKIRTLALPKFTLQYGFTNLNDQLKEMGILQAFEESADFDAVSKDLFISLVGHTAKIEVDEEGSRASAATAVMMARGTAMEKGEQIDFIADQPFIFVIRDTSTGMNIFMGEINQL